MLGNRIFPRPASLRARTAPTVVLMAFAAMAAGSATVSTSSSSARLTVGVTVVRSCAVNARPAGRESSQVVLTCAQGATPGVLAGASVNRLAHGAGTLRLHVPTAPYGAAPSPELAVVTLQF